MNTPADSSHSSAKSRRSGKRWSKILLAIVFLGILLFAASLANKLFRQFLAPWSLAQGDQPALLGTWSGPVTLDNGVTGTLVLTLVDNLDQQESWFDLFIEGSAHYCLGDQTGKFEVHGRIDRQGHVDDLRFRPLVDDPVWLLHSVNSQWQGETLELAGTYSYDLTAAHIARSGVPETPINIILQQGEGAASCPAPAS